MLGIAWPELARHFLEAAAAASGIAPGEEAAAALAAIRKVDYMRLPARDRLALLEALLHAAADTEALRRWAFLLCCQCSSLR